MGRRAVDHADDPNLFFQTPRKRFAVNIYKYKQKNTHNSLLEYFTLFLGAGALCIVFFLSC